MKKQLVTAAKLVFLGGAFALTGCALLPDTVHPTYVPQANVQKVPGADKVAVEVIVKNEKKYKNEVSMTKDEASIDLAGVYMHVKKDFSEAIDKALKAKGFRTAEASGSVVDVDVEHFYFHSHIGYFSLGSDTGSAVVGVKVYAVNKLLFSKKFTLTGFHHSGNFIGQGRHDSSQGMLNEIVNKIVNDPNFIDALLKSGQVSAMSKTD